MCVLTIPVHILSVCRGGGQVAHVKSQSLLKLSGIQQPHKSPIWAHAVRPEYVENVGNGPFSTTRDSGLETNKCENLLRVTTAPTAIV